MAFWDRDLGIASSIFLALFVIMFVNTGYVIIRRVGWKSRFTAIFIYAIIRMGAQISAIGFSSVSRDSIVGWLVAYLVLGAEGYFTLVLSAFMFLCVFQVRDSGRSYLRPKVPEHLKNSSFNTKCNWRARHSPAFIFHSTLIPANALLIAGGSMASGVDYQDPSYKNTIRAARALRCTGQATFLCMTIFLGLAAANIFFRERRRGSLLTAVLVAWPFLVVRGVYGILAAVVPAFDYYNFGNYTNSFGLSKSLVIGEYVMGVSMEYLAATSFLVQALVSDYRKHSPTAVPEEAELETKIEEHSDASKQESPL